ncbi:hypothetical protein SAMN05421810_101643 [Amycolatopsis arida]|uniref:Uncharacterized protein n=1 Tax=Amycolatopsis arida TaxID=587909 RepID=A0A1I5LRV9_9PSEU|nr:hypothetical protein [Amycolatopsis arida]TDX93820.1 hypothetical protein CLV69_104276 [Amycolatopsis arida]SFO99962.1 hypothetical protein SAMN05421810_101643 [Amycolatopsis arida]
MACKITHKLSNQELRFANRDAAERYAEIMGGGVDRWVFSTAPRHESAPRRRVVLWHGTPAATSPAGTRDSGRPSR